MLDAHDRTADSLPAEGKGQREAVLRRLMTLAEQRCDNLWTNAAKHGEWVRAGDVPSFDVDELLNSGLIQDESRQHELEDGADPAEAEIAKLREWWLERQLDGGGDADSTAGYALANIADDEGNKGVALILRTGYSFSGLTTWVEGVFESEQDAIRRMEADGWCS